MSPNEVERIHKEYKTQQDAKEIEYISHATLWYEMKAIKEHELKHLKEEIDDVKEFTRENRKTFMERLDRLDARLWGIMVISVTTLLGIVANIILT